MIKHFQKNYNDINYISIASQTVKKEFNHFPVIINFLKEIAPQLKKNDVQELNQRLQELLKKKDETYLTIFKKAFSSILKFETVLTISHSKTLIEIFKLWKKQNPKIKVIICESRPGNEGILMGNELIKHKIQVEIITEAMIGQTIKNVDAVFLGADQILSNGNIINKTGSRILAIAAKHENVPVFVLSTLDKRVIKRTLNKTQKTNKKIKSVNDSFEEIEKELLTRIFTD